MKRQVQTISEKISLLFIMFGCSINNQHHVVTTISMFNMCYFFEDCWLTDVVYQKIAGLQFSILEVS